MSVFGVCKQNGAVLVISLIILLIMTLLGLNGLRTVSLEEKMATAVVDRALVFQAVEAALRTGEERILTAIGTGALPRSSGDCHAGLCAPPDPTLAERWLDSKFEGWVAGPAIESGDITIATQYFVETISSNVECVSKILHQDAIVSCSSYRITARSDVGENRANVMLQSTYVWPN